MREDSTFCFGCQMLVSINFAHDNQVAKIVGRAGRGAKNESPVARIYIFAFIPAS